MRHIRTRRRFKVILTLLFTICLIVFIENRIEDLAPHLKRMAEINVEKAMEGKADFSIGSISGGIIHPISLNDIRIKQNNGSRLTQSIVIDGIRTNYYLKDIIRAICTQELPPLLDKKSRTYINFSIRSGDVKGFVGLHGDLGDARIDGYLLLLGRHKVNFGGYIKNGTFDVDLRPDGLGAGSIRLLGASAGEGAFKVDLKVSHLMVGNVDISCQATTENTLVKPHDPSGVGYIEGSFEANNLALNFKPVPDIKASYKLTKESIELVGLKLGDIIDARGAASFTGVKNIDFMVTINGLSLKWLALTLGAKDSYSAVTGTMDGKIGLSGPARKMKIDSRFDIRGGTIGSFDFDYITARFRGELPFLKIEESRVTRKSGYLELSGELDVRRIGKRDLFNHVKLISDDAAISWDEWSSTQGSTGLRSMDMKKNFGKEFGFGYKAFMRQGNIDESMRDSDEVQFNYNLQPKDSLKVSVGQDKDFFGFEHKDKF